MTRNFCKFLLRLLLIMAVAIAGMFFVDAVFGNEHAVESLKYSAEERVIDLPQDGDKWFISVIGEPGNSQYENILKRFDRDANLAALKAQVHFWNVPTNGEAYRERYEKNTDVLPTVRVQQSSGKIVWEGSGRGIPLTSRGLYIAIKESSLKAMAILPWRHNGTILPWRNKMENKCRPVPKPPLSPPKFVPVDPEPAPIDDGGPPEFDDVEPARWLAILAAIASAVAGGGYGLLNQWKKITGDE